MRAFDYHLFPQQQSGMALIIGLVILLVMTLLGATAMRSSSMQEKISSNMYERNLSFQAAESALREGEAYVEGLAVEPIPVSSCGEVQPCVLIYDPKLALDQQTDAWWIANGNAGAAVSNVTDPPRYVIQYLDFTSDDITLGYGSNVGSYFYAITGRGTSGANAAQAIIKTTYVKRH